MRRPTHAVYVAVMLAACGPAPTRLDPSALRLSAVDTILRPNDGIAGQPIDLAVDRDGHIYLSDPADHRIVVLDSNGAVLRTIGRGGRGPGEMTLPRALSVAGDTLRVLDSGNDQVHVFTRDGAFIRSFGGLPGTTIADVAFNRSGSGLIARHGFQNAMALRFGPDGHLGTSLGTPPRPPDLHYDFAAGKAELAGGRIPAALRNYTAPALSDDGGAWVLHIVDGTVDRYTASDSLVWTAALPDSILRRLRDGLFERTRQDTTPAGYYFPSVFLDGRPVGDTLWILLQGEVNAPAELALLGPDGKWLRPIRVMGVTSAWRFGIAPGRRALYMLDKGEGTLLRAALP